jgi:hypothetical protein
MMAISKPPWLTGCGITTLVTLLKSAVAYRETCADSEYDTAGIKIPLAIISSCITPVVCCGTAGKS